MSAHGRHIKVVGYGDPDKLGSADVVRAFLLSVVRSVGMRPLSEPQIHDVELDLSKMNVEPFEDEGGVTGVVVLSTSHCSIHTWPLRSVFVFDLYSCRDFNDDKVITCLADRFGVKGSYNLSDLTASLSLPEPPSAVRAIMLGDEQRQDESGDPAF